MHFSSAKALCPFFKKSLFFFPILSYTQGRNSVKLLEFIGKIIGIVKAAGIGDLTDRAAGLISQHIFRLSQSDER